MSQPNPFISSQATSNNDKAKLVSRNDHQDRGSLIAGLLNQHKDVAQSNPNISESTSIEQVATSTPSTPSSRSDDNGVQDVCGASTCAGIKQNAYPCEPCEARKLTCDGVRPMCNNCETAGRRCSYEH